MQAERILVTGGMGFIGSFVVDRLVGAGHRVRILDNLEPQVHPHGIPDYANDNAEFVRGDVRDPDTVAAALDGMDRVVHLAAAVGVGQGQYQPIRYAEVNVAGTARLLEPVVNGRTRVRKIVVAGSMSCYGEGRYRCDGCGPIDPPLRTTSDVGDVGDRRWEPVCPTCGRTLTAIPTPEDKPRQANSIYAITKETQEEMVLNLGNAYRIPAVSLRFFNAYGPRQSLSNPYNGVAAIFLSRAKNGNRPTVFEDGRQTRDFVWIEDVAEAIERALFTDGADGAAVNIGSGEPVEIAEVARAVARGLGIDLEPNVTGEFRTGDVRHCFADMTAARERLGFAPRTGFADGIARVIEWSRDQQADDRFDEAEKELRSRGLL